LVVEIKGLITKRLVGKRVKYVPAAPDALISDIERLKISIDDSVSDLRAAYEKKGSRPRVQYFEGRLGVRRTIGDLLDTLKRGETYYRYGARSSKTNIDRFRPANFLADRDKKQLQRFIITNDERAQTYKKDINKMVKTVPKQVLFADDVQIMIYVDKISIVDFESETGIIIEHKKLANFQRKLFKLLFERL
jgi:sugar-specific transcriptional regulator TrmB